MDRLARLRSRSSAGGPLNASTTSSLAAGYETANDESLTSGSGSMYFSMTEGGDKTKCEEEEPEIAAEEEPTLSGTLATSGHSGVDQTLENDFSVEEVSTIRKATIAHASPATVQVAAGMAVKYLGVSSTPAPKTPKAAAKQEDLSGFDQLDQTPSIMKKMRDPKTPAEMASFTEDPEESKVTLDGSGVQGPVPSNKSYGTNVLANFFASLDVNSGTPAPPEIKVSAPEEAPTEPTSGPTPSKRDSNSLENFFESLKKNPQPEAPANKRKSLVRKSLIPKVGSIVAAAAKQNRVASPISRRSTTVRLIPDKLREMRKTNQQSDQLVQFRRKSTMVPAAAATAIPEATKTTVAGPAQRKSMAVAAVRAVTATTTTNPALKRKSVVPTSSSATAVNGRKSVLPAVSAVRRGVVTAAANPPRVALKIPAKTTLSNGPDAAATTNTNGSTTTRRTLLGKRPATTITTTATAVTATSSLPDKLPTSSSTTTATEQPAAKQRKSLAPVKEASPAIRVSPRNKPATAPAVHLQSRIRPPTGIPGAGFKKPETFTCDRCQRIFRLKSSYETHLKTVHSAAGAAAAPSSSTSTNSSLNKSSEGSNNSGAAAAGAKCQYCGKAFAGAKFLTNHVVSNCLKIPLLEKRRLLAEGERERAANLKRTPDGAKKSSRMSLRPPTGSGGSAVSNRSASSTRSGDETDTSTCSSNGGGGGGSATGSGGRKKVATAKTGSGAGGGAGGGISRTPNKELKCHLCARRFLNAVEYALHVQAHAKNLKGGGGDAGSEDVENVLKEEQDKGKEMTEDVAKLVQKLVTIKNRNGIGAGKVALKSSNSGHVSK